MTLANGGTRFEPRLLYAAKHAGNEQADKVRAPVARQVPVVDPANWDLVRTGMWRVVHGAKGHGPVDQARGRL